MKAFSAWQRRNAVDEIEKRKNLHVAALIANTNWDDEKNDREGHTEDIEKYYETLKNWVWNPNLIREENEEMQDLEEADPFLRAGKRSLQKVVDPKFPNEDEIMESISG